MEKIIQLEVYNKRKGSALGFFIRLNYGLLFTAHTASTYILKHFMCRWTEWLIL